MTIIENPTTRIFKDSASAWRSETRIFLGQTNLGKRVLSITTMKVSQGIGTVAKVTHVKNNLETWVVGRDYWKHISSPQRIRCTEKNTERLHTQALVELDAIISNARKHYE